MSKGCHQIKSTAVRSQRQPEDLVGGIGEGRAGGGARRKPSTRLRFGVGNWQNESLGLSEDKAGDKAFSSGVS